ncbi:MAG: hypothetical protein HY704_02450 [Gemmatimonadetes bacterium]|nr:hypothetical protein [Gemmatimonadota bacterium]
MRRAAGLVLLVAALAGSGCYAYAGVEPGRLTPGDEVRVHLARSREVVLSEIVVRDAAVVAGRLVGEPGDTLVVFASSVQSQSGTHHGAPGVMVELPAADLAFVEERRLHRGRTAVAAAGFGAAVGSAIYAILSLERRVASGDTDGEDGGTPRLRFQISIPWR